MFQQDNGQGIIANLLGASHGQMLIKQAISEPWQIQVSARQCNVIQT